MKLRGFFILDVGLDVEEALDHLEHAGGVGFGGFAFGGVVAAEFGEDAVDHGGGEYAAGFEDVAHAFEAVGGLGAVHG